MSAATVRLHRWDEIALEKVTEMLSRKIVTGERGMLAQVYLKAGCVVPMHAHESEQMTYILQGALRFLVGGEEITVREGEVLQIPSQIEHQAEALDDTFSLDVFSPIRHDWLDRADDDFRGSDTIMLGLILLALVALLVVWAIASYNRLVGLRNQTLNGWRQIDVQLKRRHDLIPNLVNAVRGSMDFERDTLTAVMEARAKAQTAVGPADAAQKEGQLSLALGRLLAVAENYPTLKSNDNVKMLQEELSATENKVGFARQFYNDIATKFNTAQQVFPTSVFAGAFGFKPAELFEITEAADRAVPTVDLSRRGTA